MLFPIRNGAISFVRGNDASASTWHPHHANDNLFGFKGAASDTSLCALKYRHFQVLDLNAGCILIHHQARGGREKRDEVKSKHSRKYASLYVQHWYLLKVRRSKGGITFVFFSSATSGWRNPQSNTTFWSEITLIYTPDIKNRPRTVINTGEKDASFRYSYIRKALKWSRSCRNWIIIIISHIQTHTG